MKHLLKGGVVATCLALTCLLAACGGKTVPTETTTNPPEPSTTQTQPEPSTTVHVHSYGQWQTLTEASCTEEGLQERSCDCGEKETQTIAALGHKEALTEGKEATCTEDGLSQGRYCPVCQTVLTEQETIPALGHQEVVDKGQAATCTETGLTDGKHCGRCQIVLEEKKEIPALGHEFKDYVSNNDATCLKDGTETAKCTRCDETDTRTVKGSAKGHTAVSIPAVEASCTIPGLSAGSYCAVCEQVLVKQELVVAYDHNYKNGFCTRCGSVQVTTSFGLSYALNADERSYTVTGIGTCTDLNIVIPEVYRGLPVTAVGTSAFTNCTEIISVTMLNGVKTIGQNAFKNCYALASVTIPDGVESIGAAAFEMCSSLTHIKIPHSLKSIGEGAFYFCANMKGVYITDLAGWCGMNFENMGANPLSVAGNLYINGQLTTTLTIPETVTKINAYAFTNCTSIKSLTISGKTTQIGTNAFYFNTGLTELTLGNGVQIIGESAFEGCSELTALSLPASVKSVGDNAFTQCSGLQSIAVDKDNKVYSAAGDCLIQTATKTLIRGCDNSVIPTDGSVKVIGTNAFSGCKTMQTITIPKIVDTLKKHAFNNCPALTEIVFEGSETRWQIITKEENWAWDVGTGNAQTGYTLTFLKKEPPLELIDDDITLSPTNGTSYDLFTLIKSKEEFERSQFICVSADESVVRVDGTKVIAVSNKNTGVKVTITYGDETVTCLVRVSNLGSTTYSLNKTEVTLTLGKEGADSFELKLLGADGKAVKDVQWQYSPDFPKCCDKTENSSTGVVTITAKAVTSTLTNGTYVKVYTSYNGQKYECIIRVKN